MCRVVVVDCWRYNPVYLGMHLYLNFAFIFVDSLCLFTCLFSDVEMHIKTASHQLNKMCMC